jgi:predicted nucleic acid-binding protein
VTQFYSQQLIDEFIGSCTAEPKFKKYFSNATCNAPDGDEQRAHFIESIQYRLIIALIPKDDFLLALAKRFKASHLLRETMTF